jgi:hypothetical protein
MALLWLPILALFGTLLFLEECDKLIIKIFNKGEKK